MHSIRNGGASEGQGTPHALLTAWTRHGWFLPPAKNMVGRTERNTTLKDRFRHLKPLHGVIAAVAAMVLVLGAFAGVAFADQEVHVKHATLDANQGGCVDSGGTVTLWHFVITGVDATTAPGSIHVYWGPPASTDADVNLSSVNNGTAHYETTANQGSLVTDATALLPDSWTGQFNLSHVTCQQTAESSVSTTVHDAAHQPVTSVALGTQVHDKVDLTTTPTGVTLPASSSITVNYFDSKDCSGTAADTTGAQNVSGQSSPVSLENQLPKTVGAGQHSYQASFTSGDTNVVKSSTGACEPFEVTQGTSTTTTEVHDANHANITNGQVQLGAVVHDTATVTGVPAFPATGTVTFSLYKNSSPLSSEGDCTGTATSETLPVGNTDPGNSATKSSDTAPLGVGYYGYQATYNGDSNYLPSTGKCEPFEVTKGTSATSTEVHDANHANITNQLVQLGSVVHDTATVTGVQGFPINSDLTGTVTFKLYKSSSPLSSEGDCTGTATSETLPFGNTDPNGGTASSATQALAAGYYGYQATYNGDSNYLPSTGKCEPFQVTKGDTVTTTQVHDAAHTDVTDKSVALNSYVHDKATVSGNPAGFAVDGTVTFSLYKGTSQDACSGDPIKVDPNVTIGSDATDGTRSSAYQVTTAGYYGYKATYSGNDNYNGSIGACEPFTVVQPGKTMGYWGNTNGQNWIATHGGFGGNNAVAIGRGSNIDTQPESKKVLPNTLNACGKGTPFIFVDGAQTTGADCTLAPGINKSSLNTLAAQTLALGYNLNPVLRPGFSGQTLGLLQCDAGSTGLTNSSSVGDAFAAAYGLIDHSEAGDLTPTTQTQIGAMNTLLGCLNREA